MTNIGIPGIGYCFNPHPARKPGDAYELVKENFVKIIVSIRTRPESRVMPQMICHAFLANVGFNPHPARKPGDAFGSLHPMIDSWRFQSAPGPKAG